MNRFHQTLDAGVDFAAQVAFNAIVALDDFAQASRIGFAQVAHTRVRADTRHFQNLLRRRLANTVDVGQRGFNSLVTGQINPGNTCHLAP
jgi:hypothetical protein